jgi:endonuclease/exonuclease/phosphatase family metal-dependent hydrolase
MRVATFNMLNGRSPEDQRVHLAGLAAAVRELDADVLALQEVDHNQHRSELADLTAVAAEAMGAPEHRFVAAIAGTPGATWIAATGEEHPDTAAYGIALLSRYPVHGWHVVRLPRVPGRAPMWFGGRVRPYLVRDEPRVAVIASVEAPFGMVTVANAHLTFVPWWNGRQLRHLTANLVGFPAPVVLMGDLNMGLARAGRITGMWAAAAHPTFPREEPTEQLDHVLVGGRLTATDARALTLPVSDHRALRVELSGDGPGVAA